MGVGKGLDPPENSLGDIGHVLAKAAISAIPFVGSPAAEVLSYVFGPPIGKRQQAWMNTVAEALRKLSLEHGIALEDLRDNDAFIDAVAQASQIAMRTGQDEKLQALRNAIQNSALPSAPEQEIQQLFIRWVDEFTPSHLKVLKVFQDPMEWHKR